MSGKILTFAAEYEQSGGAACPETGKKEVNLKSATTRLI